MKKQKFRDPGTFEFRDSDIEHPSGESMTIPDDAMGMGEILEKFSHGLLDTSMVKDSIELGEDEQDIDDDVESPIDFTDIIDRQNILKSIKASVKATDITKPIKGVIDDEGGENDAQKAKVEVSETVAKK
jgi:hypothetical protein